MTYQVDQSRIKEFYRIQAIRMLRTTTLWTLPFIIIDLYLLIISKPTGVWIIGLALFTLLSLGTVIRTVIKPQLPWKDLIIEINYEDGELTRTGTNILPLTINLSEIGRVAEHKEGLLLFKRGWHSWLSTIFGNYNLNERSSNFYIPLILDGYDGITAEFKSRNWLQYV